MPFEYVVEAIPCLHTHSLRISLALLALESIMNRQHHLHPGAVFQSLAGNCVVCLHNTHAVRCLCDADGLLSRRPDDGGPARQLCSLHGGTQSSGGQQPTWLIYDISIATVPLNASQWHCKRLKSPSQTMFMDSAHGNGLPRGSAEHRLDSRLMSSCHANQVTAGGPQ